MLEQAVDESAALPEPVVTANFAASEVVPAAAETVISCVMVCTPVPDHISLPLSFIENAVPPTVRVAVAEYP